MKHEFINVKTIFDKYKIINVPYYQRDYVWGQKNDGRNLYKFIDDIFTQYDTDSNKEYFIGTLAFCSAKVNDVIDGQQRLTSLVLLLSILADSKCSEEINELNKSIIMPEEKFVIQEKFYLTEELKYNLGLDNNFNSQGYKVNISKTVDRIRSQINRAWDGYTSNWYDGLYNYILNKVMLISLEYNNISESLKYFLNINSLSIQLTQSDIFFSILSQSIRISDSTASIFLLKQKIAELGKLQGMYKEIEEYKAYDNPADKGTDNVIYLFLNAYYQKDKDIMALNETGIGKWMSFYKNEVFNDAIKAQEFTNKFISYLKDLENLYNYFSNMNSQLNPSSSIYTSWVLLQYEAYGDILKMLVELFKTRHNYIEGCVNLYSDNSLELSYEKINQVAKRLNLTLFWNYIRSSNKRLDNFISNITVDTNENYKRSIDDIVEDMDITYIFNLTYNDKKAVSNVKIKDESRLIKVIMGLQEAFLNFVANDKKDLNEYLQNILSSNAFSIEHLYSVNEYNNKNRLANWIKKKNKFTTDYDFDTERFKFENLSLLNTPSNSSAGDDEINGKIAKYKNARKICGSEWEYLILSLVDGSEYYRNQAIQNLNLPERKLINLDQNTWELSPNNRSFNINLLKMALNNIAEK